MQSAASSPISPWPVLLTLLVGTACPSQDVVPAALAPAAVVAVQHDPLLPRAVASFGACRSGGWLYTYGGHVGRAHAHSHDHVIGSFQRLNLADNLSWQELPSGPALQGTALVAGNDGALYRVGGMTARNAPGAAEDLHSTATVARFCPRRQTWSDVTPLPEPRSSHDAIVLDDQLYVVGGWHLHGSSDGTWHQTAWVADLRETPLQWRSLPAPAQPRRAAAVATFAGQIALLGGIDDEGPTANVELYDPATGRWRTAPTLPGFAFGTAALGVGDALYATVFDGRLLRLRGDGDWQAVAQLEQPRLFHRLLPANEPHTLVALGGAGRTAHLRSVETLRLDPAGTPVIREFAMPAPSRIGYRQALLLQDDTLWAFGGNRDGDAGDRFAATQFATDVWRIDLADQTATQVAELPSGCQSMAATSFGERRDNVLLGGLGVTDTGVGSLAAVWQWDPRLQRLHRLGDLPAPKTQCEVVHHGKQLWVLGGIDFTPDADGGATAGDRRQMLVCDLDAGDPCFVPADVRLPRARRSFGAAVLADRLYLVGGLGEDFAHAGPIDVFDFAAQTWQQREAPVDWVSPQVAVIGDRLFVACGGTMRGQRFTEDRSLWSFTETQGWRCVVPELPFAVRHMQMLALRDRLLFYAVEGAARDRIVIRVLLPPLPANDAQHAPPAARDSE